MSTLFFILITISVCFYIQPKTAEDWKILGGANNRLENVIFPDGSEGFTFEMEKQDDNSVTNDVDMKFDLDLVKQDDNKFTVINNENVQSAIEDSFTQSFSKSLNNVIQSNQIDEINNMFTKSFSKTLKQYDNSSQVPLNKDDEINNMFTMSLSKSIYGDNSNRFNIDIPTNLDNSSISDTNITYMQNIVNTSQTISDDNSCNSVLTNQDNNSTQSSNINPEFMNQFNSLYNDIMQMLAIKAQRENTKENTNFLASIENDIKVTTSQQAVVNNATVSSNNNQITSDSDKYNQLLQQFNAFSSINKN